MAKKAKSHSQKRDIRKLSKTRKIFLIWGGIAVACVAGFFFLVLSTGLQGSRMEDVFEPLKRQGFIINHGFSAKYQPGNIVQVKELAGGKEVALPAPILVRSAKVCFPGKVPEKRPYTLPRFSGSSSAKVQLGARSVAAYLPNLAMDGETVSDYSLNLGGISTVAFEKFDLSRKLSEQCTLDLRNALADGDRIDWFKVIHEAVIADSFRFECRWQSGANLEARKTIEKKVIREIDRMGQTNNNRRSGLNINAKVHFDADKKMVVEAQGTVVLAYKVRPLDTQKGFLPEKFSANSKIAVQMIDPGHKRLVKFDHPFVKGDKFRFEIVPGRNGNLSIFHQKSDKELELGWPRAKEKQKEKDRQVYPVKRGKTIEIPPSPAFFFFDKTEYCYVVIDGQQSQSSVIKEKENFVVRDYNGSADETTRFGYDSGKNSQDPYLYFTDLLKRPQIEVVAFRLGR